MSSATGNTFGVGVTVNSGTLELACGGGEAIPSTADFLVLGDGVGGAKADVVRELAANQIWSSVPITINSSGLLDLNNFNEVSLGSSSSTGR